MNKRDDIFQATPQPPMRQRTQKQSSGEEYTKTENDKCKIIFSFRVIFWKNMYSINIPNWWTTIFSIFEKEVYYTKGSLKSKYTYVVATWQYWPLHTVSRHFVSATYKH